MKKMMLLVVVSLSLLMTTPASAQSRNSSLDPGVAASLLTSFAVIGGGLTLGGASTAVTIILAEDKRKSTLARYLRDNEPAVRRALAVGGGDVVRDLADVFDVPADEIPAFGARLRKRRPELLLAAYADGDLDEFARVATGTPVVWANAVATSDGG